MPFGELSIRCAQIFWTPAYSLVEFQCAFCLKAFAKHYECLSHLKICPSTDYSFDTFPDKHIKHEEPESTQLIDIKLEFCGETKQNLHSDTGRVSPEEHVDEGHEAEHLDENSFEVSYLEPLNSDDDDNENIISAEKVFKSCNEFSPPNENAKEIYTEVTQTDNIIDDGISSDAVSSISDGVYHTEKPKKPKLKSQNKRKVQRSRENDFSNLLCRNQFVECDICGEKRKTRRGLLGHMRTIHIGDSFRPLPPPPKIRQCPYCPKTFTTSTSFAAHKQRHTSRFSCEYCGVVMNDKFNLRKHIRTHTGEKPFTCRLCDNKFASSTTLQFHMRWHLGEKPYKCPDCPMAFVSSGHLRNHSNIHTRERRYVCSDCGKVYSHISSLKLHQRSHTGEAPLVCKECGRAFSRPSAFSVHMNTHTGNSPYACKYCERRFHSSAARRSHEKNVHKIA